MSWSAGARPSARRAQAAERAGCGGRADNDRALQAVLGLSHPERLSTGVQYDIAPPQIEDFPDPHARLAQEDEDQPIRRWRRGDRGIEGALLVLFANRPREALPAAQRGAFGQAIAPTQAVAAGPGEEAEEGGDPSADRARRRRGAGQPGFQVLQAEVVQRLSEPRVSRRCRKLIAVGTERMRPQPFHVAEVGEEGLEAGCHGGRAGASCPACQRNPA